MSRTAFAIASGAIVVLAGSVSLLISSPCAAGPYPPGLSAGDRVKFDVFDARVIEAIRGIDLDEVRPADLAEKFFREHLTPIIREVFGNDWSPIRAYADAALADLPVVDETTRFAAKPTFEFDLRTLNRPGFAGGSKP